MTIMDYDKILDELGHFSKWHMVQVSLLSTYAIFAAFGILSFSFTGLEPEEFRCLIPECHEDPSNATVKQYGTNIFWHDSNGDVDYCKTRPIVKENIISGQCTNQSFDFDENLERNEYVTCDPNEEIIYGTFGMNSTAVTEFNLVCRDEYKVFLTASITMSALLVGSYVFGYLADRFGRKIPSVLALFITGSGLMLGAFMPEYISFTTTRFISGFGSVGVLLIPCGNCVEIVGVKYKMLAGLLSHILFPIGEAIIGALAVKVRDYSTYQWILAIPCFIMGIVYILFISESPRWLIKKKKYKEATKILQNMAKFNDVKLSSGLIIFPTEDFQKDYAHTKNQKRTSITDQTHLRTIDLFKHAECRKITLIMMTIWISVNLGYYGIALSSTSLSSDIYLNFILQALVEIPSTIICILTMDHIGRKTLLVSALFLCGICCVPAGYAPVDIKTALVLIGKSGASMAFAVCYIHTVEMYPTVIRGTGLGLSSLAGRIGGLLAPLVALYLPNFTFETFPLVLFGSASMVSAISALWLPETLGAPLVEELDELRIIREHSKPFFSWWSSTKVRDNVEMMTKLQHPIIISNNKK